MKSIRMLATLAGFAFVTCTTTFADAATCASADTVRNAASTFLAAARSGSSAAFGSAISRYTNVEALALFALGKYRSDLPPARRAEYVRNAHRYISQFLAENAGRFKSGSQLTIKGCKGNLVTTSFGGGSDIVWRVSGSRIEDVRVSGVWLAQQLRQNFTNIIRRNHGYVTSLLDYLAGGRGVSPELRQKKS